MQQSAEVASSMAQTIDREVDREMMGEILI